MRRVITQIGQSIYEWLFTRQAQDNMVALGKLTAAVLGTTTVFNGLAVTPTAPASLQVNVGPGEIYALSALEGTTYGTLAADTTHQIMKQGIQLDAVLLTCAAPPTAGQSINYLIQASFAEQDLSVDPTNGSSPVVLQFYNADNPTQPWNGPNNTGQTSNTFRQGSVVVSAKAGIAATTGSQVTPAPDAGYVGVMVVTVANGQTTIVSGNITTYTGAPAITERLGDKLGPASVVTSVSDPTFANSTSNPASTSWVRGAMAAIATAAGFQSSFGTNSYIKLPSWLGGAVYQWGSGTSNASGILTVTFPLPFPNACRSIGSNAVASSGGVSTRVNALATTTSVDIATFSTGTGNPSPSTPLYWSAWGN